MINADNNARRLVGAICRNREEYVSGQVGYKRFAVRAERLWLRAVRADVVDIVRAATNPPLVRLIDLGGDCGSDADSGL